jgi:hypothetical protein
LVLAFALVLEWAEAYLDRALSGRATPRPGGEWTGQGRLWRGAYRASDRGETVKTLGPLLPGGGIVLVIVGMLAWTGALSWLGNLPGDIRITTENARIYIPFTSMLLISLILNVLVWFFLWLFKH